MRFRTQPGSAHHHAESLRVKGSSANPLAGVATRTYENRVIAKANAFLKKIQRQAAKAILRSEVMTNVRGYISTSAGPYQMHKLASGSL